jgi:DNA mismatch repair ATPase MutL
VDGLRLVQQEAHRALEQARAQGTLRPRPLLIPVLVRVGAQAATQAEVHGARLQQWGLDLHPVSADAVRLHAVPDVAVGFDAQRLVLAVLAASASDDASLLYALSEAAALPKAERERVAMLARAAGSGCQVEFGPERLAQLVREGK